MTELFLFMFQCYEKMGGFLYLNEKNIGLVLHQFKSKLVPQLFLRQGTDGIFR